jgi:hypothetical protein
MNQQPANFLRCSRYAFCGYFLPKYPAAEMAEHNLHS